MTTRSNRKGSTTSPNGCALICPTRQWGRTHGTFRFRRFEIHPRYAVRHRFGSGALKGRSSVEGAKSRLACRPSTSGVMLLGIERCHHRVGGGDQERLLVLAHSSGQKLTQFCLTSVRMRMLDFVDDGANAGVNCQADDLLSCGRNWISTRETIEECVSSDANHFKSGADEAANCDRPATLRETSKQIPPCQQGAATRGGINAPDPVLISTPSFRTLAEVRRPKDAHKSSHRDRNSPAMHLVDMTDSALRFANVFDGCDDAFRD